MISSMDSMMALRTWATSAKSASLMSRPTALPMARTSSVVRSVGEVSGGASSSSAARPRKLKAGFDELLGLVHGYDVAGVFYVNGAEILAGLLHPLDNVVGKEDALLAANLEDGAGEVAVDAPVVVNVGGVLVVGEGVVEKGGVGLPLPLAGGLLDHLVGNVLTEAGLLGPGVAIAVPLEGFFKVVEGHGRRGAGYLNAEGFLAALGADVYDDDARSTLSG